MRKYKDLLLLLFKSSKFYSLFLHTHTNQSIVGFTISADVKCMRVATKSLRNDK